jgi:hypothetical protein
MPRASRGEHPVAAGPVPRDPLLPGQRGHPQAVDQVDRVGPVRVEVVRVRRHRSRPTDLSRRHGMPMRRKLAGRVARLHLLGDQSDSGVESTTRRRPTSPAAPAISSVTWKIRSGSADRSSRARKSTSKAMNKR